MNIYCIEQNYYGHKRERENFVQGDPVIYVKTENGLLPTGDDFIFDQFNDRKLYCQVELVIKISKSGKNISEEEAPLYYDKITTGINFTSIDIHDELNDLEVPWQEAKGWSHSSVGGIWFPVTDFRNKNDINFCLYRNREMLQMANSELMMYNFSKIIAAISKNYSIQEGDLIFTGSPAGGGELFEGDQLEAFLEDDSVLEFEIRGK